MKITYFKGEHRNFGDELNLWLWPKLLPNFFDEDESVLFLGIGSIISDNYRQNSKKIVFGAGFVSNYFNMPDVARDDWDVFFVRGPRTARTLNIPQDIAIGDSAILVREVVDLKLKRPSKISFMPHWQSVEIGNWQKVCEIAGINFIDPRRPVSEIMTEILSSKKIVTEAMHGAIVADALRIPWIPLMPINSVHREKWFDWAEAFEIDLRPYRLFPSTLKEADHALVHRPFLSLIRSGVNAIPFMPAVSNAVVARIAAHHIKKVSQMPAVLSTEKAFDHALEAMLDKLELLKNRYS